MKVWDWIKATLRHGGTLDLSSYVLAKGRGEGNSCDDLTLQKHISSSREHIRKQIKAQRGCPAQISANAPPRKKPTKVVSMRRKK